MHMDLGRGSQVHEKTSLGLGNKVCNSLRPRRTIDEEDSLHRADHVTTWFGVSRADGRQDSDATFMDHGRYAQLIAEYPPSTRTRLSELGILCWSNR